MRTVHSENVYALMFIVVSVEENGVVALAPVISAVYGLR